MKLVFFDFLNMEEQERNEKRRQFIKRKIAIRCETEEQAKDFIAWCHRHRLYWAGNDKKSIETNFSRYKDYTCYIWEEGGLCHSASYLLEEKGCEIVKFKDFSISRIENEKVFERYLKEMVHKRMSIAQMIEHLNKYFYWDSNKNGKGIFLDRSSDWDNNVTQDYNLVGSTEHITEYMKSEYDKPIYCNFDIYVLPTKQRSDNGDIVYYVTMTRCKY